VDANGLQQGVYAIVQSVDIYNFSNTTSYPNEEKMRTILLTTLLVGSSLIVFAQNRRAENVTIDFFYGTWTDSTKTGITLTREKEFLTPKREKMGLEDVDYSKIRFSYKIFLDKSPIVIEISCEQCDDIPGPKLTRAQIEIVNSGQIYFTPLDQNGKTKKGVLLTKE